MANIEIRSNLTPILDGDQTPTSVDVARAQQLVDYLSTVPLHTRPEVTLGPVLIGGGGWVESYDFVVVRRFRVDGNLIVGGENGEVFNVSAAVTRARNLVEMRQDA